MMKSPLAQNLSALLQKLSPKMLLLSLLVHGLVLFIPFSSSLEKKSSSLPTIPNSQPTPLLISNTELFSEAKTLVKPKQANNPLFTSKLPPIPSGLTAPANQSLPIPVINPTQLQPPPPPPVIPTKTAKTTTTKTNQNSPRVPKSNQVTPKSSIVAKKTVAPENRRIEKKKVNPVPTPKNTEISQPLSPVITPEEEAFDDVFVKLYEEIDFSDDLNFSEPDKFALMPGVTNIFGTAIAQKPEELAILMTSKLEAQGFSVVRTSTFAGGQVYEVKKGKFIEYVTLTPDMQATGTIIVTWSQAPTPTFSSNRNNNS
jgi:hypothetical protein